MRDYSIHILSTYHIYKISSAHDFAGFRYDLSPSCEIFLIFPCYIVHEKMRIPSAIPRRVRVLRGVVAGVEDRWNSKRSADDVARFMRENVVRVSARPGENPEQRNGLPLVAPRGPASASRRGRRERPAFPLERRTILVHADGQEMLASVHGADTVLPYRARTPAEP